MLFFMIMDRIATTITGTVFNDISTWIRCNVYYWNFWKTTLLVAMDFISIFLVVYGAISLISNRMANRKSDKKLVEETKIRA